MESILLIEDDTTLAMGIEYSLKDEGMEVEVKYNVKDGYDIGEARVFYIKGNWNGIKKMFHGQM